MSLSATVEDYLKCLLREQPQVGHELLATGRLATAMNVAPGTATAMVKTLAEGGLVDYEPRSGVRLTTAGRRHALNVVRRHRLIELFLAQTLGLDWTEVHAEAERLEHAISEKVLRKLDELLGCPQFDPHGDPIPAASGHVARPAQVGLFECALQQPVRIGRVIDQDPQFLLFAQRHGLTPGAVLVVESRDLAADTIALHLPNRTTLTLGRSAAAKILVEPTALSP